MRPHHRDWLNLLNAAVEDEDFGFERRLDRPATLLVTGAPRTGTTLMLQSLQAYLPATVIDHLAAAFWRRPVVGVALSEHLRARSSATSPTISFSSEYGLTPNWYEPHEFSYFWRDVLPWGSPHEEPTPDELAATDFSVATTLLDQAASICTAPLATKAFPLLWCGLDFLAASPRSVLLVMQRDPSSLRESFARARASASEPWFSLRPRGWSELLNSDIDTQLDFQVDALLESSNRLLMAPEDRVIGVALTDLVDDSERCVRRIGAEITERLKAT